MHFGNLLGPPAHDLDADPARARFELLGTHRHTANARMKEDKCGNSFGERFDQRNMFLRDDHSDRIRDQVVGDNVTHVFGYVLRSKDVDIDIESDVLRLQPDWCDIPLVVSNHEDLRADVAMFGVRYVHIPVTRDAKPAAEARLLEVLGSEYDLIVLARYMQILSPPFVDRFPARIINIHHSFLPAFVGANPYRQAYEKGVKLIGATAHYVTAELDQGPIIEQALTRCSHRDSVEDLVRKGRDLEKRVLGNAVRLHLQDRVLVYRGKTVVFD